MSPFLISNFFSPNDEVRRLGDSTERRNERSEWRRSRGCLKLPCRRDDKYPRYILYRYYMLLKITDFGIKNNRKRY